MSIEFYCAHCYQKVVTPDQTAGKKGRCPFCSEVVEIPLTSQTQGDAPKPGAKQISLDELFDPASQPRGPSPSKVPGATVVGGPGGGPQGWRESHEKSQWGDSSRESKFREMEELREQAKRTLALPAVGIIIASVFGMVANAIWILVLGLSVAAIMVEDILRPEMLAWHMFFIITNIAIHTMLIIGANHMRMVRSYTTAIAGAILALLPPPLNVVWPFSAPFAIWSLVLLARKDVSKAFRRM